MEEFNGKGFNDSPLTGAEAAQIRHFFATVSKDWDLLRKLVTVVRAFGIIYEVVKQAGPIIAVIAAIGYFLKTQGLV
ncbi:hypothetical protein EVB87_276 [Rhizobium phage RHph_N28_1]|nr:hypothetical protein EVB87_276 [Rhizobium phage RHph_N28_1]QIG74304.1 hypothetical protein EVC07_276 [Rhizobium phage RHph_N42]QXV73963.1 hypothetical protein [Rhizobium phage RHph_N46]